MIIEKNGIIKIPYPNSDSFYEIRKREASLTLDNTNYSNWIIQLAGKTWVTMGLLEELAEILKQEAPEIDWDGSLEYAEEIIDI